MAALTITEQAGRASWRQLALAGEVDLDTVSELKTTLERLAAEGVCRLILVMEDTRYVNSTALATLVKFAERFREAGGGIALVRLNARARVVFDMLGLLVFFRFFDDVAAARTDLVPADELTP